MIGHIDEPLENSTICAPEIVCRGWAYSEEGISSIKIYIDGKKAGNAEFGLQRMDVKTAMPDYPDIEESGFIFSKIIPLDRGSHRLKVKVREKTGKRTDLGEVPFSIKKTDMECTITETRRRVSFHYLEGMGIELGAMDKSLPTSGRVVVKYVDRLSSSELLNHYPDSDQLQLVKIDVIDNGETLSTFENDSLDFIVANHFLEHCENPIGTIRNHLKKIKQGGILFYTIPEKNFTFDKDRPLTTFEHLISEDIGMPAIPRKNHFYEWVTLVEKVRDVNAITDRVSLLIQMNYSIHYHVWDIETIFQFLDKINDYLKNQFRVLYFEKNENEIISVIQKK